MKKSNNTYISHMQVLSALDTDQQAVKTEVTTEPCPRARLLMPMVRQHFGGETLTLTLTPQDIPFLHN